MKKGFSVMEAIITLFLLTIVIAGILLIINQAFKSVDSQIASLKTTLEEQNMSIDGWKGATPTNSNCTITDITTSTIPATFSSLGNYMKVYKVEKQTPFGTLNYKIVVISK
jgi:predicted PurR-regulated permease PerM